MPFARYYDPSKNTEGGNFHGVPLGNLTEEQFADLPEWMQVSIDESPMYRKTPVPKPKKAEDKEEEAEADEPEATEPNAEVTEEADETAAEGEK